mmetsp:Transcript_2861/g.6033  ORF Transcript_2861/g.6033 Transcript_2861/m.6033 type:complete len:122 (+) Transcript_2861:384-749(+)
MAHVQAYNLELRNAAWTLLHTLTQSHPGLHLLSPGPGPLIAPIVALGLPNSTSAADVAAAMFQNHGMVIKVLGRKYFPEERGPDMPLEALRFSFHVFNTHDDVTALVRALDAALNKTTSNG